MDYAETFKHGTAAGYGRNKCRCDLCRAWKAEDKRKYRAKKKTADPATIPHGTFTGYSTCGCRCDECKAFAAASSRKHREAVAGRPPSDPATFDHGTASGYVNHKCRCEECSAFMRDQNKKSKDKRKTIPADPKSFDHGTSVGYNYYGCRCDECKAFKSEDRRQRYGEEPERFREAAKRHREANIDTARAATRRYKSANPEKMAAIENRRRARKLAAYVVPFTPEQLAQRFDYYGNRCYLQLPDICIDEAQHADHVKPLSKGGPHMLANLRPACQPCNSSKKDKWPYPVPAGLR
jgi:5-methylcytosine-specific restriction endonuclease McrA